MIADYKIRDAATEAAEKTRIQENERVIHLLERNDVGISDEHLQMLIKELKLKNE